MFVRVRPSRSGSIRNVCDHNSGKSVSFVLRSRRINFGTMDKDSKSNAARKNLYKNQGKDSEVSTWPIVLRAIFLTENH